MTVMLLPQHHLEFQSLKGGCRGSPESTLVKMSNCWKSHAAAHMCLQYFRLVGSALNLKSVVRQTDRADITISADWDIIKHKASTKYDFWIQFCMSRFMIKLFLLYANN